MNIEQPILTDNLAGWQPCLMTTLPDENLAWWQPCLMTTLPDDNLARWQPCLTRCKMCYNKTRLVLFFRPERCGHGQWTNPSENLKEIRWLLTVYHAGQTFENSVGFQPAVVKGLTTLADDAMLTTLNSWNGTSGSPIVHYEIPTMRATLFDVVLCSQP